MTKQKLYLIALESIVFQEVRRYFRIWVQTLLPPVITMSLYFAIFGHLIGPRIGSMSGVDYISFMVPGLIMMSVITNSYANVVSSFYGKRFQNSIEELIVSPVPNFIILMGFVLGGASRGVLVGLIVSCVSLAFTSIQIAHLWLLIAVVALASLLFSFAGFINALLARNMDDISIIPTFILTPLTYLGGVFYSIDLLPELWRGISLLNPILYIVNSFRYAMLGVSDVDVLSSVIALAVLNIILGGACLHMLNIGKGLRK